MNEVLTIADCRKGGYCVIGARRHCRVLGLDFKKLCGPGLPLEMMEGIDDANVQRCCKIARERIANGEQ